VGRGVGGRIVSTIGPAQQVVVPDAPVRMIRILITRVSRFGLLTWSLAIGYWELASDGTPLEGCSPRSRTRCRALSRSGSSVRNRGRSSPRSRLGSCARSLSRNGLRSGPGSSNYSGTRTCPESFVLTGPRSSSRTSPRSRYRNCLRSCTRNGCRARYRSDPEPHAEPVSGYRPVTEDRGPWTKDEGRGPDVAFDVPAPA